MISGLISAFFVIVGVGFFMLAFSSSALLASPLALLGIGFILIAVLVELRSIHKTLRG